MDSRILVSQTARARRAIPTQHVMTQPNRVPVALLSREAWEEEICDDLLAGVNVAAEVRDRALAIVRADSAARRQLISDRQTHLPEQATMMAGRDATIRAMLPESVHSPFDANAARLNESRRV